MSTLKKSLPVLDPKTMTYSYQDNRRPVFAAENYEREASKAFADALHRLVDAVTRRKDAL